MAGSRFAASSAIAAALFVPHGVGGGASSSASQASVLVPLRTAPFPAGLRAARRPAARALPSMGASADPVALVASPAWSLRNANTSCMRRSVACG
eukprot:scaffold32_cov120-Isochrysis_galbana.AAC.7